jgi:hypothetical protein
LTALSVVSDAEPGRLLLGLFAIVLSIIFGLITGRVSSKIHLQNLMKQLI